MAISANSAPMVPPVMAPTLSLWLVCGGSDVGEPVVWVPMVGLADDVGVVDDGCSPEGSRGRGIVRENITERRESLKPPTGVLRVALPEELCTF